MKFSVLVLDDEPQVTKAIQMSLRSTGWSIITTDDAQEAVRLANSSPPNVFVCDAAMPKQTGPQVIHTFKSDPATADIPIILMTGYCDADLFADVPWDGFLSKPFSPDELKQAIEKAANTRATANTL